MPYKSKDEQAAAAHRYYERNASAMKARARARTIEQRQSLREYVDGVKAQECADCGSYYEPYVMDFDHVRGEKTANVSDMINSAVSLARLQTEIAKCDVVCANCHRRRTHNKNPEVGGSNPSPAISASAAKAREATSGMTPD